MKLFFTLILFLCVVFINHVNAQVDASFFKLITSTNPQSTSKTLDTKIFLRCGNSNMPTEPLLVIDGKCGEFEELKKIDPDNIASIDILKDAACGAIYGYRGAQGVIIITTKTAFRKKFIIRDFFSGEKIPSATIYFISKFDSIKTAADDAGILITDKLKAGVEYNVIVSSAGYKTLSTNVAGKEQEVLLEKDIKTCTEVIVTAYPGRRIVCRICGVCKRTAERTETTIDKLFTVNPVYPNPVQRNNVFNFEFENKQDATIQLAIVSLNGSTVLRRSQKIVKGTNHLSITADARWAAGIYVIQLSNQKGRIIKQEKLIVQ